MKSQKFIVISGYVFMIFGIIDFLLKIKLFGFREFDFLWFCTITIFILGLGMILKNEILLNSFLSVSLLVQSIWILDYIWITFFDTPLNGLTLYVFRPGYSLMQFIVNAKHLYMIPFAFFSVFTLCRKNRKTYLFIAAAVIIILGSTYLFAPRDNNINCVFESCFGIFSKIHGLEYFFFWTALIIILSLVNNLIISLVIEKSKNIRNKKYYKLSILLIFLFLVLISSASVVFSYLKYSKIPQYKCMMPDKCIGCDANLECNYVDTDSENLTLVYTIKNYGKQDYACDIIMRIYPRDNEYKQIVSRSFIESGKENRFRQILPYPSVDSQIKLKADCTIYP